MSVQTTADDIRDSLSSEIYKNIVSLRTLKDSLEVMIDGDTWGSNEYTASFTNQAEEDIESLRNIIRKLKKIKIHYS